MKPAECPTGFSFTGPEGGSMMKTKELSRLLGYSLILLMGLLIFAPAEAAKEFPRKPITVVVSFPAGSSTGVAAQKLVNIIMQKKYLPQPLQVIYKPGGAGTIGLAEVLQGKADGYTAAYNPSAPILVQPLVKELPYSHRTLIPVIQVIKFPWLLAVKGDAPWKTIQDFLEYAKQHSGEVTVGTAGDYTWGHVALIQITKASGIKFRHVPFQGSVPNATALLGGHINASLVISGDVMAQVSAGKIRILASVEPERTPFAPDAPTFKEIGYDIRGTMHTNILVVPKGTPEEVVETLHEAFKKAVDTDDFKEFTKEAGGSPGYIGYQGLPSILDETVKEVAQSLEKIGVKVRKFQ